MDHLSLVLVLSLFGLKLTGLGTAFLVNRGHRTEVTRLTLWYWALNFVSFLAQGFAGQDPFLACIAVITFLPPFTILARLSNPLFQITPPSKIYVVVCTTGFVVGLLAWLSTAKFPFSAAFCAWPIAACILHLSWLIYTSKMQKPTESFVYLIGLVLCGIHLFDYPFLRLNLELLGAGFAFAYFAEMVQLLGLTATVGGHIRLAYTTRLENDILAASKELRSTEEVKTNLIRILCHDVANGLMILQQSFDKIQTSVTSEQGKKALRSGKLALNSQVQLLENIRTAVSVSTGKIQLNIKPIDLKASVSDAIASLSLAAENKSITIRYDCGNSPIMIFADQTLLSRSVITNLLSNAIKFSQSGSEIHIEVSGPGLFVIRDFGMGMDAEKLKHIFDESKPTNSLGTLGETGTGFGMVIVHNLLVQMGASIEVESKRSGTESGTEFRIQFKQA